MNKKLIVVLAAIVTVGLLVGLFVVINMTKEDENKEIELLFDTYESALKGDSAALEELELTKVMLSDMKDEMVVSTGANDSLNEFVDDVLSENEFNIESIDVVDEDEGIYEVEYSVNQYSIILEPTVTSYLKELSEEEQAIFNNGESEDNPRFNEVYSKVLDMRANSVKEQEPVNVSFTAEVKLDSEGNASFVENNSFKKIFNQIFNY